MAKRTEAKWSLVHSYLCLGTGSRPSSKKIKLQILGVVPGWGGGCMITGRIEPFMSSGGNGKVV